MPKLVVLILCFSISSLFIVFAKWCFGNSISIQANETGLAEFAVSLAPSDPQTHYSLAAVNERTFLQADFDKSLEEYKQALSLSPRDFRFWLALSKALERSGNSDAAELAFTRSRELAPNYAQVDWAYGNFLLRQGKYSEAFLEIKKAGELNNTYLQPAVSIAWQYYQGNLVEIRKLLGDSPELNSMLANFLAGEKRFDEAIEVWGSISEVDKKTKYKELGNDLFQKLAAAKRFGNALDVFNGIAAEGEEQFSKEKITNGDFEQDVKPEHASVFDWQLGAGLQPQILFDKTQKFNGSRSLVVVFDSKDGSDFRGLSQTIVVGSGKRYELSLAYRSDLKTSATLRWEVVDTEGNVLAESEPTVNQSDWTRIKLNFTTPGSGDAVIVRLARIKCPQGICPITGRIWFDDFLLKS